MFVVTFTEGPRSGENVKLDPEIKKIVIGREKGCEIRVRDPHVSGKHLELSYTDGGEVEVTDLGSQNGTLINGQRIAEPTVIKFGDLVAFGKSTFVLKDGEEVVETPVQEEGWWDHIQEHASWTDPWVIYGASAVTVVVTAVVGGLLWRRRRG